MPMDHSARTKEMIRDVDRALAGYLERGGHEKLIRAMRHYPEAGGKRMRPTMAILVAEAVGGRGKEALPFGCALELIHNFTLVHDDVIDKDPVRRGRPAVHIAFDEPTAYLDPAGRQRVLDIIRRLYSQGMAIIHIAHDMRDVAGVDRIIVMRGGRVVADNIDPKTTTVQEVEMIITGESLLAGKAAAH